MPPSELTAWRQEAGDALDRSWCERDSAAERFLAFRQLPEDSKAAWLGQAVANSLEASLNQAGHYSCGLHDQLGELLGIEVAAMWRPTAVNYFDRVPKNLCLAALAGIGGPELAALHAKSKKPELAATCERIFAGEAIVEPAVNLAALAWVPEVMRFVSPPWIGEAEAGIDDVAEPPQEEPVEEQIDWVEGADVSDGGGDEPVANDAPDDGCLPHPEVDQSDPEPLDQAA